MQSLNEIRELLAQAGQKPTKRFGQNFLIDANLMAKLLEMAEVDSTQTVLEVGPGTGSLTEELVARAGKVVAVEIDRGLAVLLQRRLSARGNLTVIQSDALAGKHELSSDVLAALAQAEPAPAAPLEPAAEMMKPGTAPCRVNLVSNLPYNVAVPILINCLSASWRVLRAHDRQRPAEAATSKNMGETPMLREMPDAARPTPRVVFPRLTFTVQRELGDRLLAEAGSSDYGPVSVIVSLLARKTLGRVLPPQAFWPPPKVHSRMMRLDFDPPLAQQVEDLPTLSALLAATFQHRRKKVATASQRRDCPFDAQAFAEGLRACGIDAEKRPEQVEAKEFRQLANWLADKGRGRGA